MRNDGKWSHFHLLVSSTSNGHGRLLKKIITFNWKRSCRTTNCVDKYWWCASSCAFNAFACLSVCVWPKCILFFNYVNTANRTALMIGINAKQNTQIKWKHIHKITVYTLHIDNNNNIDKYMWQIRCLFFFLAYIYPTLRAWKCAYDSMWERIKCTNGNLLRAFLHLLPAIRAHIDWCAKRGWMCKTAL